MITFAAQSRCGDYARAESTARSPASGTKTGDVRHSIPFTQLAGLNSRSKVKCGSRPFRFGTICQRPNRFGNPRHLQPCSATRRITFRISRLLSLTRLRCPGRLPLTSFDAHAPQGLRAYQQPAGLWELGGDQFWFNRLLSFRLDFPK